ncbi:MAG: DUF6491 family protein [Sphingomonadaceae bacterium]|uniref:DUF6491 family protein n=1 Tax=Thermaurantiacus sp. TaxID=2820283 RepID=UPI00298F1F75|nr:DUF6491 family protein [Thermaurantiacus sp.]MCS6987472.1 DUF6491 family protein [Sphingomonadaceae bacterium]MDW8415392.1 DUF6491 family protein [Thermaurantiacus sp.]
MRTWGVLLAVALVACATAERPRNAPAERLAADKASRVPAGEPVECLPVAQIRETRVLDDQTIDFFLRDGRVFRSELPQRCPQLGFERSFGYNTSIPQLCRVDLITVIQTTGGPQTGATCGLGPFTPLKPAGNARG